MKGLIFDKDGTLFDFSATWETWAARVIRDLAAGDPVLAETLAAEWHFDLETGHFAPSSPVIAGTPGENVALIAAHLPGWSKPELISFLDAAAAEAPLAAVTDLPALMSELREMGYVLGVVTNDAEAPTLDHLDAVNVRGAFDFIAGYDSGFGGKPAPGQLQAFAKTTGLVPQECAMIGDSLTDLMAGQNAGMFRIGVLTGMASQAELSPFADVVLSSIAELPEWLRSR